ncbi:TlpA family protein disulfide reductase [Candidatus Kaiserbacteria bacterium]|nr:TlpA family protein disulfide reductase [Candidatus Kaiserbacteria bacterium]
MQTKKEAVITLSIVVAIALLVSGYTYFVHYKNKHKADDVPSALDDFLRSDDDYSYTDIDGNRIYLDNFTGSILVVNSWASWSPASAEELNKLGHFSEKYPESSVKFLAINRADRSALAKQFIKKFAIPNTVMLVLDPEDRYYNLINGYNMPETVIYNQDGQVIKHIRGEIDFVLLEQIIKEQLAAESVPLD